MTEVVKQKDLCALKTFCADTADCIQVFFFFFHSFDGEGGYVCV